MVDIDIEKCSFAGEGDFVEDEPGYDGGSGSGNNGDGGDGDGGDDDDGDGDGGGDPPQCPDEVTCGLGEICQAGECQPDPDYCWSNDDCPGPGWECNAGECTEIPGFCDLNNPCPEGYICENYQCVVDPDYCSNNSQCDEGFLCVDNECEVDPDWCWGDSNCESGYYCDGGTHRCVQYPNEAPTITLLGGAVISLTLGWGYEEFGWTAFDDRDGDITDNVVVAGTVNPFVEGTYYISYNVVDSDGLSAETRIRTVIVSAPGDSDPPGPSVLGPDLIICEVQGQNPEYAYYDIGLHDVPVDNTITQTTFVDSSNNPVSEVDGVISGELINTPGAPTAFSAKLKGLDVVLEGTYGDGYQPYVELYFPSDAAADYWYRSNPGLLNSLTVEFSLEIVYSIDFIEDDDDIFEEWHRDYITLSIPIQIVPDDVPPPIAPTVDYGWEDLRILYNATEENGAPSQHSIAPPGWIFNNYQLDDVSFDLPADLIVAGYTNSNLAMPDWSTGIIFAESFEGDYLPELGQDGQPVGDLQLTLVFTPVLPYIGDELTITADVSLEVVKFVDADETPPVVTLIGEDHFTLYRHPFLPELTEEYVELGATGWDDRDGDVTASLIINGFVNMDINGVYPLVYVVFDAAGNQSLPVYRVVTVQIFPNFCDPNNDECVLTAGLGQLCVDGFCELADNACELGCEEPLICDDDGFCVLHPDLGGCTTDYDCNQGFMCNLTTGYCMPDPNYCDETTDNCGEGMECDLVINQCINTPGWLPPPVIEYDTTETAKVQYESIAFGGVGATSQAEYLQPTTWETNGNQIIIDAWSNIEYLNIDQQFCVGSVVSHCYPDPTGPGCATPPCSQSYDIDFHYVPEGAPLGYLNGSFRFNFFRELFGVFGDPPENAQFRALIHWHTANPDNYPYYAGTIDTTHDVEWIHITNSLAMTGGGGGGKDTKKLVGPKGGPPIVVPKALNPAPVKNPKKKVNQGTKLFRRSFSYTTKSLPLSDKVIASKRRRINYSNGISDSRYSFFKKSTNTPSIAVAYTKQHDHSVTGTAPTKRPSVLGTRIDETIAGILNVNASSIEMSDYYYNAITPQKIKESLSYNTNLLLRKMYNLNGTSMKDSLCTYLKRAIISNEIGIFTENDLEDLSSQIYDSTGLAKSRSQSADNKRALRLITKNLQSINPEDFNIKKKNRLIYWKPLAEDLNKRLVFETADGTTTDIFIPNNEKITVEYSNGKLTTLEMQDGDFFIAETLENDNRLSVYSDIEQARIISPEVASQASYLANDDFYFQLDATSIPSTLVELNVDTTSARQDYYFLALDKDSVSEQPLNLNSGDTLFTRKTYAKYNYLKHTDDIDEVVKHKAYPNLILYLRDDDMFFNHLEVDGKAQLTHKDITLDNFENSLKDQILIRQLPQHILIIPSDKTDKVISHQTSKFINFNTRRLKIRFSPIQDYKKLPKSQASIYLRPVFTETESLNFGMDIQDNIIWREKIKFVFDTTAVLAIDKYKNGVQVLPRKESPMTTLLKLLNNIKEVYSLTDRDRINTFDLFSRMVPSDYKSLSFDVDDEFQLLSRLAINNLTDVLELDKANFVKTKGIANIPSSQGPTPIEFLPINDDAPQVTPKKQQTVKQT